MNHSLSKKKLLILGGKPLCSCELVETAKRNGIYTIVTDYLDESHSPAKTIADESWDISTADIDKLSKKIEENHIDGIFTGIHEFNLQSCLTLCEKLNLPFYATRAQWTNFSNKELFRELCQKYNVPAPKRYDLSDKSEYHSIKYPIIIKPVDGSASRGITVCKSARELDSAISHALSFSKSKRIVAEQYISGSEIMIYYYIHNSDIFCTGICDRFVSKLTPQSLQLPNGYCFPSMYTQSYLDKVDNSVRNMLKGEGCRNGVFSLQAIVHEGNFYVYEACYRLCGTQYHKFLAAEYEFDELDELIYYSINGRPTENPKINVFPTTPDKFFFCLPLHLTKGLISHISGFDTLSKQSNILDIIYLHGEHDKMMFDSHFTQIFARIYISATSRSELIDSIQFIKDHVHILDENDSEMIVLPFDTSLLKEEC